MSNDIIAYKEQDITISDMEKMADAMAKGGLFGIKTKEQYLSLMLIAQSEGRHPASVAMSYDIIQNKPALKSQAALMRFQEAGGKIRYITRTDAEVSAEFTHPAGGTVTVTWDMKRAAKMGFAEKDNWKKQPMIMLQWRVVAEGVRACFPACLGGSYLVEEVQDFAPAKPAPRDVTPPTAQAEKTAPKEAITPEVVAEAIGGEGIDHETGEIIDNPATGPQLNAIGAILTKLGIKDDMARHEKVSNALAFESIIPTMKDLTKSQASEAIKILGAELAAK